MFTDFPAWQGQSNGVAHRSGMLTGFQWEDIYITYFQDRVGNYPGIRAAGLATSYDGINWSKSDEPFFTVEDVQRIIPPSFFEVDITTGVGRVYVQHAETDGKYVYCAITVLNNAQAENRQYSHFVIRGTDPFDARSFEYVEQSQRLYGFYFVGGKWIVFHHGSENGVRGARISITDSLEGSLTVEHFIPSGIGGNPYKFVLSKLNGRWAILYSHRSTYETHLLLETK